MATVNSKRGLKHGTGYLGEYCKLMHGTCDLEKCWSVSLVIYKRGLKRGSCYL
jgi:hypothetical protein